MKLGSPGAIGIVLTTVPTWTDVRLLQLPPTPQGKVLSKGSPGWNDGEEWLWSCRA